MWPFKKHTHLMVEIDRVRTYRADITRYFFTGWMPPLTKATLITSQCSRCGKRKDHIIEGWIQGAR